MKVNLKAKHLLNTTIFFLLVAPVIVLIYISFVFNPAHADNMFLYGLLLLADSFGIVAIMSLWLTILMDVIVPEHHHAVTPTADTSFLDKKKTIDVFITTAGEPVEVVKKTAIAAKNMDYPHKNYLLDDASSQEIKKLAKSLNFGYITRETKEFAKAGNINNALKTAKGEFFAILDADQVPEKEFLTKLIPHFADEKMGMAQSPQYFTNMDNFIASGTSQAQYIFYKYVLPARNTSNSVFCVGTNVVFRRNAIDEIGGIARRSHSEDVWTSYQLHQNGWKTIFVNEVLARGLAPDTIRAYFRQQLRWARGGLSMLFTRNPLAATTLTLDQRIQYFFSNSFYLVGISIFAYCIFPIAYLLFNAKPLETGEDLTWLFHYLPYVALYYLLTKLLLGKMRLSVISVAMATFYPYLLALVSVLFGSSYHWVATTTKKTKGEEPIMKWIWPHLVLMGLTLISLFVGWYNPVNFWATVFYTLLAGWNLYLLYKFISSDIKSLTIN